MYGAAELLCRTRVTSMTRGRRTPLHVLFDRPRHPLPLTKVRQVRRARVGWFFQAAANIPWEPWLVFSLTTGEEVEHDVLVRRFLPEQPDDADWWWRLHWLPTYTIMNVELDRRGFMKRAGCYFTTAAARETDSILTQFSWQEVLLSKPPKPVGLLRSSPSTLQAWLRLSPAAAGVPAGGAHG